MASRMERYHNSDNSDNEKRINKNSSLYDEIYETRDYDKLVANLSDISVDTIATSSSKQIDIAEVKALLEKREEMKKNRTIVKDVPAQPKEVIIEYEEMKTYDINDILNKARVEKNEPYRLRKLEDTQALTLQELVNSKEYSNKSELDEGEMKDLIDTLYQTNILKNINGDGILDDLKSSGNTIVNPDIKQILKEKKEELQQDEEEMDKSFYTSNLNLKKTDFINIEDKEEKEVSNKLTTALIIILGLIFLSLVAYIIIQFVI